MQPIKNQPATPTNPPTNVGEMTNARGMRRLVALLIAERETAENIARALKRSR
jgi:cobalamin-dependent methionine synthase I